MKLDILVIAAHPDDAELGAGGTIAKAVAQGKKVGILDLTRGEMGTRGTPETRAEEAQNGAKVLGVSVRENVGLPDGFLENTKAQQMAIIPFLRKFQPEIVLANAIQDRHPDHAKAAKLIADACFLSGLRNISTAHDGVGNQKAWRPSAIYHFVQDHYIRPDFVVDITDTYTQKIASIKAYTSQFYSGTEQKPEETTPISTPQFLNFVEGRAREFGRWIGAEFGEGFTSARPVGIDDLFVLK